MCIWVCLNCCAGPTSIFYSFEREREMLFRSLFNIFSFGERVCVKYVEGMSVFKYACAGLSSICSLERERESVRERECV